MLLTGRNLGERHKQLNSKVNEAASKNVSFDSVKDEAENSDVDVLFKIDLASKLKNVDYIIDILKSGDSLHISRALNSLWLYEDAYSSVINPDYLHQKVFPFMSRKMKLKMLTTISMHVRNEKRAESFYIYSMNTKLPTIAMKFLIFTSEEFKLDLFKNKPDFLIAISDDSKNFKFLMGTSFALADCYLEKINESLRNRVLHELRYLYSADNTKYLDLLEKYSSFKQDYYKHLKFGLRISTDIVKKFKDRILKNPLLYVQKINLNVLAKHSTTSDAKIYAARLLPATTRSFWWWSYCKTYKPILELIPPEERFNFVKTIFTEKYPGEKFEMTKNFYDTKCYDIIMTEHERETWALENLENGVELLGSDNNHEWYKLLNFERAFMEVKKQIYVTPDHVKRAYLLEALIDSAKDQSDIKKLLNHYYDRHINENVRDKEQFLDKVIEQHKVYEFNQSCWEVFYKLMSSVGIFGGNAGGHWPRENKYVITVLIYYIINKKEFSADLQKYVDQGISLHGIKSYNNLCKERQETVIQHLYQLYFDKIQNAENQTYNEDLRNKLRPYLGFIMDVLVFNKKSSKDIPEIVNKYIKLDWERLYYHRIYDNDKLNDAEMLRLLKKDTSLITNFDLIKENIEDDFTGLNMRELFRKLKIYFFNDVAQDYVNFFTQLMSEKKEDSMIKLNIIDTSVYGIFQLASESFKNDFMQKHIPANPKIDYGKMDNDELHIQMAICRYACFSRPHVPLSSILNYIKGDYLQYCLPMFNYYLANLPPTFCLQFVEALISSPVSVQKHGLRLAFHCFSNEDLKKLVMTVWNRTNNISIRMVMYTTMFQNILLEDESTQCELLDVFKTMTLDLHQNDHEDVFKVLIEDENIPDNLKGVILELGWQVVRKFPATSRNLKRKASVLSRLEHNIALVNKDFIKVIVEEHIQASLNDKNVESFEDMSSFNKAKWDLVATYAVYYSNKENIQTSLELIKSVIKKCLDMWDQVYLDTYTIRKFCTKFISQLAEKNFELERENYSSVNPIFEAILEDLTNALQIKELYLTMWELKLLIITNKVIDFGFKKLNDENHTDKQEIVKEVGSIYATEVTNLVEDLIKKKLYHHSFSNKIAEKVDKNIENMTDLLPKLHHKLHFIEFYLAVGHGLTAHKLPETYLMALNILPTKCPDGYTEQYKELIDKIKDFQNCEVDCCLHQKFVINEFKKRKYI